MTKHWTALVTVSLATLLAILAPTATARADIFRWEYINPANPSQGKQPSTMLCVDGAGANAVPAANLSNRNLTMAYLIGADLSPIVEYDSEGYPYHVSSDLTGANLSQAELTNANLYIATLSDANLSQANLTNANFQGATLTGANLTDAQVQGANFYRDSQNHGGTGLTLAQLYSTTSYQAHDLTGINLGGNNLTGVNLADQNLTNAGLDQATLTGANLSQANLTNAKFFNSALTAANFSGADVRGANLGYTTSVGFTAAQLYSTASYQAHDLTGIGLYGNNLAGWNFTGQNLTNANFSNATLTAANFSGADVRGANFDNDGIGTGITPAQLYSTTSYQAQDLTGIGLVGNIFTGANFAGQNLTNANFNRATLANANLSQANLTNADFSPISPGCYPYNCVAADLTGANLSQANLTNAKFSGYSFSYYDEYGYYLGESIVAGANLTGANLSGADARGASFQYAMLSGANTSNLIQSDGHIAGLDLSAGQSLVVRDYDGNPTVSPPIVLLPIIVDGHLATSGTGTLRMVFDADPWDSTIAFAPGIPVALGGTLELDFAPGVDVDTQSGRTIDLFDWTGVAPTGAFTVSSPYTWNLSNLYTTGEVTLASAPIIPGDFNHDDTVDAADYVVWRKTGINGPTGYNTWRANFGTSLGVGSGAGTSANAVVPEPATIILSLFALAACASGAVRRRRTFRQLVRA